MWSCALKTHQHLRTIHQWGSHKSDDAQASDDRAVHEARTGCPPSVVECADVGKEEMLLSPYFESALGEKVVVKRQRDEEVENNVYTSTPPTHRVMHEDKNVVTQSPQVMTTKTADVECDPVIVIVDGEDEVKDVNNSNGGTDAGCGSSGRSMPSPLKVMMRRDIFFRDETADRNGSEDMNEPCHTTPLPSACAMASSTAFQEPLLNSPTPSVCESSVSGAPSPSPSPFVLSLSEQQKSVFDLVVNGGRSVFLTGGAGTGKSHLLRVIIAALPRRSTFVTATTGMAALNLGGATLHSFAGCGLIDPNNHTPTSVYHTVQRKIKAKRNWRSCSVLVVDEVSMMDAWLLDVLEYVARRIRGNCEPFGGIQVVFSGDFLQLPPVTKGSRREPRFCFEAAAWCRINPRVCILSQRFRQKDDIFFSMLNEMRYGALTAKSLTLLSSLSTVTTVRFVKEDRERELEKNDAVESKPKLFESNGCGVVDSRGRSEQQRYAGFTILRARRAEVEAVNIKRFSELETEIVSYKGYHSGEGNYPSDLPSDVSLRAGCRVMLLKNLDVSIGLVNGSIGTLVRFINARNVNDFATKTTPGDLRRLCDHSLLPVVRFDAYNKGGGDGPNSVAGRLVMIEPHRWTVTQGDKEVSCSIQIPLQLAYSITIHKSQGMSLSHVNVDFKGIFEEGQAYVALSRCTDMNNLVIENFDEQRVSPNAKALAYYKALEEFVAENNDDEEERRLVLSGIKNNPWGPYDIEHINDESEDDVENDGNKILNNGGNNVAGVRRNAAVIVESIRLRLTPTYILWSALRTRVLSATERATSVSGALLVMDVTSLLVLSSLANSADIYEKIFFTHQNMLRVPRSVKEDLLRTASQCEADVSISPTMHLSFSSACSNSSPTKLSSPVSASAPAIVYDAAEVAWTTLCIMEDAKKDFVLDEQRHGESRDLPAVSPKWEMFLPLLLPLKEERETSYTTAGEKTVTSPLCLYNRDRTCSALHLSLLEFSCYLREQYSANRGVFVCTESIQLAACALAVGLRVCSITYLCPRDSS